MNEEKIGQKLKVYLLINAAIFYLLPLFGQSTGIFILLLLVVSPLLLLIAGLIFGLREGWYWWYFPMAGVLFAPCLWLYYNSTAWIYLPIYALCALIGQLIGCALRKSKK